MARQSGVKFTHIPGKGGGEGIAAVLGKHVMMMVESPAWAPMVASGQFRLLMMLGQRSKKWPDAPTLKELGYTYEFDSPFGLAGPKGMDPAIVKKLHDAFKLAYDDPKVIELYDKFDFTRRYMSTRGLRGFRAEARSRGEGGAGEARSRQKGLTGSPPPASSHGECPRHPASDDPQLRVSGAGFSGSPSAPS